MPDFHCRHAQEYLAIYGLTLGSRPMQRDYPCPGNNRWSAAAAVARRTGGTHLAAPRRHGGFGVWLPAASLLRSERILRLREPSFVLSR